MSDLQESFISHLLELRSRLIKAMSAVLVAFLALVPWSGRIYDILAHPLMANLPPGTHMIATGVITPFLVPLKVTLMAGFVVALPVVLYQAWAFVAPGLYAHEKRLVAPVVVATTALFLLGMAFCYFFVFGTVFHFITQVSPASITPAPDIEQYLSFVLTMFVAFGATFEVPVVVVLLVRFGVVTLDQLRAFRPYAIVGAFVVAAVLTPPDITSQIMLAVPMCLLFEAGLLAARFVGRSETA
ncbi:MAG TPA: twin-arginine translocase subunit TatC [Rhodocyclaceae bacterium]|nr:twin-arginine translocase subunit TatC [Rhodocyclaceae bacterium]